jgi:hypothetical protein
VLVVVVLVEHQQPHLLVLVVVLGDTSMQLLRVHPQLMLMQLVRAVLVALRVEVDLRAVQVQLGTLK